MVDVFKAIILGIVEGITEWLPVSSTGHLILVNEFIKMNMTERFMGVFNVVIQLGAIIAVLTVFFNKLNPFDSNKSESEKNDVINLWIKVIIAVIPSGVIGILFDDYIEAKFFNPLVVSIMLIFYGVIMILLEMRHREPKINSFGELSIKRAIGIGIFQCLALIPGTSRSAATIIGGVYLGASRYIAAEFSFFLAIPTMLGASALKLLKAGFDFTGMEWVILLVGTVVSYVVSIVVIKFLLDYIRKHDFKVFGYYRIILGIILLIYFFR